MHAGSSFQEDHSWTELKQISVQQLLYLSFKKAGKVNRCFTFANRLKQPNLLTMQWTSGSLFPFPLGFKWKKYRFMKVKTEYDKKKNSTQT